MSEDRSLELPEHVVVKIQKVLGISLTSLPENDLVSLIEDLCDTALMFDREERGAEQTEKENPLAETAAAATTGTEQLGGPGEEVLTSERTEGLLGRSR